MKARLVGINARMIFVQTYNKRSREWNQQTMSYKEFDAFMQEHFPGYYEEYRGHEEPAAAFFYNYGETVKMRRKGEAYIYEA